MEHNDPDIGVGIQGTSWRRLAISHALIRYCTMANLGTRSRSLARFRPLPSRPFALCGGEPVKVSGSRREVSTVLQRATRNTHVLGGGDYWILIVEKLRGWVRHSGGCLGGGPETRRGVKDNRGHVIIKSCHR